MASVIMDRHVSVVPTNGHFSRFRYNVTGRCHFRLHLEQLIGFHLWVFFLSVTKSALFDRG